MSFQTGLSGLNSASKNLDVIGNNIANANTVGMKYSRTEFSSLVASQLGAGGGGAGAGIGVAVGTIAQQFTQGNISITGNNLDVAINGGGFFQVTMPDGSTAYTRDGQFKLDSTGNLITNSKANIMGYPTDLVGNRTSVTPQKMVVPTSAPIPAQQTKAITAEFNLDSRTKPAITTSPPTPISTYGTTMTTYDSQGNEVPFSLSFVKVGPNANTSPAITTDLWDVFDTTSLHEGTLALTANASVYATDTNNRALNAAALLANPATTDLRATLTSPGTGIYDPATGTTPQAQLALADTGSLMRMTFDNNGKLSTVETRTITTPADETTTPRTPPVYSAWAAASDVSKLSMTLTSPKPAIGTFTATLDMSKASQYGTAFAVSNLTQDGYTAGDLTGITIDPTGVITTRYSNGQTQAKGQLLLADFRNVQGLTQLGGGNWAESYASGQPVLGNPGLGKFGGLRSGALEDSNVDLTGELVNMMTAQRDYQANAQTIKTQDQAMSTLINLR